MLCVEECPYDVICAHPDLEAPYKCSMCLACVNACPRGAIQVIEEKQAC
jgi:NAD-dependent dihydropyrimidine dehydrogenase PreA subunit